MGFNRRIVTEFKLPAAQAEDYLAKAIKLSRDGDAVTAVLNPETVSELIAASSPPAFGRRRSATIKDPKGSVTFQIPNGVLTEFTLKLGGSREFFDRELKLDRTITTSITGIGTTRLDVPDDAKEIVDALIAGRRNEVFVPEPGFRKLFDGRTLAGWEGQPGFWSVQVVPSRGGPRRKIP